MTSRWLIAEPASDELRAKFPQLHPVVLQLLASRGLASPDEVEEFLNPDYEKYVLDPFLFREMEQACARVWFAIEKGEKVVIHGDYDADGITGLCVLMTTFREAARRLGKDPSLFVSYIPHREKEGYGVRPETVELLAKDGATLMITVDCGIGCAAEIALAAERGMDTIVVDHHQIPEKIPACVILHPLVAGETYPYKKLAAVGVAFKFACGFIGYAARHGLHFDDTAEKKSGRHFEKWLLDLVAIATVTDFVPLIGENRTLERFGLKVLNKTKRPGMVALIAAAGLEMGGLDTASVGFYLGPRINAASRMEHAEMAFKCLMAETPEDAAVLAEALNQTNKDRQKYTEEIMIAAKKIVAGMGEKKVYCICGEGWSAGIVGLVAGKLVSELGRPVFVFGKDGERIVGSGRSIAGFNVVAAMEDAKDFLARFGGHPQACGLTIEGDKNYAGFCARLDAYAEDALAGKDLRPLVPIEAELRLSQVTWELVHALAEFEPFGEGNPRPKFLLRDLLVSAVDTIGKTQKTVRITARGDLPRETKLIGFNFTQKVEGIVPGVRMDAVVEIGINDWNGRKEIQLKMTDVRVSEKIDMKADALKIIATPR
jgi:single-stranded-DNA-specific exonuclease